MRKSIFKNRKSSELQKQTRHHTWPNPHIRTSSQTLAKVPSKTSPGPSEADKKDMLNNKIQEDHKIIQNLPVVASVPQFGQPICPIEFTQSPSLYSISPQTSLTSPPQSVTGLTVTKPQQIDTMGNSSQRGPCPTCGRQFGESQTIPTNSIIDLTHQIIAVISKLLSRQNDSIYVLLRLISWAAFAFVYPVGGLLLLVIFGGTMSGPRTIVR
jgi:hypothetical protein